jgi:hypothetical protein
MKMEHFDYEQGSPQWLDVRKGVITGSKFKDARDRLKNGDPSSKAKLYAMNLARERCHGTAPGVFVNDAMRQGTAQEPIARAYYESVRNVLVEPVGFFKTHDDLYGLSPDGLIDDDGVLEIKTMVSSDTMFRAMVDGDIEEYVDQCNGYLWLLERKWVDLCLWAPDMAEIGMPMLVIRIERHENDIEKLEADLTAFAGTVRMYESALRKAAIANKEKETA